MNDGVLSAPWRWGWLLGWLLLLPGASVLAQNPAGPSAPQVVVAPGPIPVDQPLEVSVELTDTPMETLGAFPELPGFKKTTRARQTTTRQVGQQTVTTLRVTQRYLAFGEGDKTLPPFTIQVNGQPVRYPGGHVRMTAATTVAPTPIPPDAIGYGLADELFGKPKAQEFREVPDQARLSLDVAPGGPVWAGQGVRVRLYLTIAPEDQAVLEFAPDFGRQMELIKRDLTPPDAWEEQPPASTPVPDTLRLSAGAGEPQLRLRFLLHEAVFYPLSANHPLRFPGVALRVVKYRLAKKPVEGADNRLATTKTLVSQPAEIPVRALPPHPRRGVVPVGALRLTETLAPDPARVGQPARYRVEVSGPGNLAPVAFPDPLSLGPPGVAAYRALVTTVPAWPPIGPGAVGSTKRFQWELVADRPGIYRLDSLVALIYFDPTRGRYDTLRATRTWRVQAAPRRPRPASAAAPWTDDPFYSRIEREPLDPPPAPDPAELRRAANAVLALLALAGSWLIWQRQRG